MHSSPRPVVIESPMSFTGSGKRILRLVRPGAVWWVAALRVAAVILAFAVAWSVIAAWYCTWGLPLVPWRVYRRGQRKQRAAERRHEELLGRLGRQG